MSIVSGSLGAVMGANATEDAANTSAAATKDAAAMQTRLQREMFYRQLADYEPYKQLGLAALPMYQSAILGGPVKYNDPNYKLMSGDDIAAYNKNLSAEWVNGEYGKIGQNAFLGAYAQQAAGGKAPRLSATGTYYRGPNGEITQTPPQLTAEYNYKESPTLAPQISAYNRALASRGLSGSGQASKGYGDLAAGDYYKQLSLLGGLVDVGRGVATSTAGAAQNMGNSLSSIYGNVGAANSNAALLAGQARAGLYSGLGAQSGNAISNAYNGYKLYNAYNGGGGLAADYESYPALEAL